MGRMFRLLRADEIEARVSTCTQNGVSLLLYKDARCDQNILDETVDPMNWQRTHSRDNANCSVGIWDKEKQMWVWKEDTGTESFTEKEKGLASDSFKRACFNWGIGRELYTAPFIWVSKEKVKLETKKNGNGVTTNDKFEVRSIGYDDDGRINALEVWRLSSGKDRPEVLAYSMKPKRGAKKAAEAPQTEEQAVEEHYDEVRNTPIGDAKAKTLGTELQSRKIPVDMILTHKGVKRLADLNEGQHAEVIADLDKYEAVMKISLIARPNQIAWAKEQFGVTDLLDAKTGEVKLFLKSLEAKADGSQSKSA